MSADTDPSDDSGDTAEVEQLKEELRAQKRELKALAETLREDRPTDEEVVKLVDQRLGEKASSSTRRNVMQALVAGGAATLLGGTAGAATSSSATQASLAVGDVTTNTYKITGNKYGGPASARSELTSELDSDDAGAKYKAQDTGALYHWTGSSWTEMPVETPSINTDEATITNRAVVAIGPNGNTIGTYPVADYADIGDAANAAINDLPNRGDSNVRAGTCLLPEIDATFDTSISVYERLTIRGRGIGSTVLEYTGGSTSDPAFYDANIRASSTARPTFADFALNCSNGADGIDLFQPQIPKVKRVYIQGNGTNGSNGIRYTMDGGASVRHAVFEDIHVRDFERCLYADDQATNGEVRSFAVRHARLDSTRSDAKIITGDWAFGSFVNITSDTSANTVIDLSSDASQVAIVAPHMEGSSSIGTGLDASGATGKDIIVIGGRLDGSTPLNDPNNAVTTLGVKNTPARVNEPLQAKDNRVELQGLSGDSPALRLNGTSTDVIDIFKDANNDEVRVRNVNQGLNLLRIPQSGGLDVLRDQLLVNAGGPNDTGQLSFGNTRIFEDANGEVVVEDTNGNQTTIS